MTRNKTVIVTGASQGIGATVVQAFRDRGYNNVPTSRSLSKAGFAPSADLPIIEVSTVAGPALRWSHERQELRIDNVDDVN